MIIRIMGTVAMTLSLLAMAPVQAELLLFDGLGLGHNRGCGCQSTCGALAGDCVGCSSCAEPGHGCQAPSCGCEVASGGCDAAGACEAACDACVPCCVPCCDDFWLARAGVVFLRRTDSGSYPLITDQNTGDTLLDADNLEFDHMAALRLQLVREYCCCWGWDVGFLGLDSWNTTARRGGERSPVLNGPGFELPSTAPGTIYEAAYGTDLYSFDANIRYRIHPHAALFTGFRWIELGDDLRTYSVAPSLTDVYSVNTNNHLYGWQIGVDTRLFTYGSRFSIDAVGSVGVLGNDADQRTNAPILGAFPDNFEQTVSAEGSETAFVADLAIRGVYQLTTNLAVYGGYEMLFLDGVALAPDQISVTDLSIPATAALDTNGSPFFHGASVGMQVSF